MRTRKNYIKRKFNQPPMQTNLECISLEDSSFALNVELIVETDFMTLSLSNGRSASFNLESPEDIYKVLDRLNNKITKIGCVIRRCYQCIFFGFSTFSFDSSGGNCGYCTLIHGLQVSSEKDDVVNVFDSCDGFELRKIDSTTSPWLP